MIDPAPAASVIGEPDCVVLTPAESRSPTEAIEIGELMPDVLIPAFDEKKPSAVIVIGELPWAVLTPLCTMSTAWIPIEEPVPAVVTAPVEEKKIPAVTEIGEFAFAVLIVPVESKEPLVVTVIGAASDPTPVVVNPCTVIFPMVPADAAVAVLVASAIPSRACNDIDVKVLTGARLMP